MNLSPEKRIAGILVPLFALRGENDLGIGDLGALREFIGWASEIGFKLVQLLPINETGADNSPYNAISAMAIEPTTLRLRPDSPEDLTRDDFNSVVGDVDLGRLWRGGVKYRHVKKLKRRLLEKAFANFSGGAGKERQLVFEKFCQEEAVWLDDYAFFRVLMEANGESATWTRWPAEHQSIKRARAWLHDLPQDRQAALMARQNFFCYVQWIAHQQWREIKSCAEDGDVALMGDIPFGVSYYSADVFARPDEFALDWSGAHLPSHFSRTMSLPRNGGRIGASRFIAGTGCGRTISHGGVSVCVPSGAFFTSFASITCSDFIASTHFRGDRGRTNNFCRWIGRRCSSERAVARRISHHEMTKHRKTAMRISVRARNICALLWKRLAQRASLARTLAPFLSMCGRACVRLVSRDLKFRNGKFTTNKLRPETGMSGFPLRLTLPTITNRFGLCGRKRSRVQRRHRNNQDSS